MSAENAVVKYEAGREAVALSALTDDGGHTLFAAASAPWSRRSGSAPVIRPDGLISGGAITPAASGTEDLVDVAAGSAYIAGALVTWFAAADVAVTRGLTTDTHNITSITATAAGAVAAVSGADHTAFSAVRADDGGPPLIPVTSVELGQVRTTSVATAAITDAEIFDTPGLHTERFDTPIYSIDYAAGTVMFASALPPIHTGAVPKAVYASYAVPTLVSVPISTDFVPPENSYSVSSTQVYQRTIGQSSASLGAGSFTAYLEDGVTDALLGEEGQLLWFHFYPDELEAPYIRCQGKLGITRTFPASGSITAKCTIAAEAAAENVAA